MARNRNKQERVGMADKQKRTEKDINRQTDRQRQKIRHGDKGTTGKTVLKYTKQTKRETHGETIHT